MVTQGTTQQQIFADIGVYRGVTVALKHIRKQHMQLTRDILLEFNAVRVLDDNLHVINVFFHKPTTICHSFLNVMEIAICIATACKLLY